MRQELSYDNFHTWKNDIYRIDQEENTKSPAILGPTMVNELAGVKAATRIRSPYIDHLIKVDETLFTENALDFKYIDPNFFDVFSFELLKGNEKTVIDSEEKVVLTASTAKKYFGDEDPIGKVISVENFVPPFNTNKLVVSGIVADPPKNSHIDFTILASLRLFEAPDVQPLKLWAQYWVWTYLLLDNQSNSQEIAANMRRIMLDHVGAPPTFSLRPLKDIYLHTSNVAAPIGKIGNYNRLLVFSLVGMLVLLVATINFVNLTVATSIKRAKEIGVKKALGANKNQLTLQFLSESLLVTTLSSIIAFVGSMIIAFNSETWFSLELHLSWNEVGFVARILLLITLTCGFLAGIYPALFLTKLKTTEIVKGQLASSGKGRWTQKTLIVFQFAVSLFIISSIIVVERQMDLIENQSLGFDKEQTLVINCEVNISDELPLIKSLFQGVSGVRSVAGARKAPGFGNISTQVYRLDGVAYANSEWTNMFTYHVGPEFIQTMGIEVLEGRGFSKDIASDEDAFVINETAIEELVKWGGEEWRNPIGKVMSLAPNIARPVYKEGPIIGVVKDFNYRPLYEEIKPLAMTVQYFAIRTLLVKVDVQDVQETVAGLNQAWDEIGIEWPFEYSFLDQNFSNLYEKEIHTKEILKIFAFIAVIISCLGLWGLVILFTERKRKEISIRKVLGSPIQNILQLLLKGYVILILIAFLITVPISWYTMNDWLTNFAYRTEIGPFIFVWSLILVLSGALLSVGYISIKAAKSNPVKYLRMDG